MTDMTIINADVVTMDPDFPRAAAVVVKEGKICRVDDASGNRLSADHDTPVLDLEGKTLCPGFIDAHLHFRALAESTLDVGLQSETGIRSIQDIQQRLSNAAAATPYGDWVRGVGYHETGLSEGRHPDRHDLDEVSHRHPIKLTHRSGYAHVLNTPALTAEGISRCTPDPEDGIIDRDLETGEPTGVLFNMGRFLSEKIPPVSDEVLREGVKQADELLLSHGVTLFQDASYKNDENRRNWFEELKQKGELTPGVIFTEGFPSYQKKCLSNAAPDAPVPSGGVKVIVDETTGRVMPGQAELDSMVDLIHRNGRQAVIHAIETDAVKAAVSAIEKALRRYPKPDHRHRIEHCSLCPPGAAKRIAAAGIWVVTHPAFVYHNGDRYLKTVSRENRPFLYPSASLIKRGVQIAAASDAPMTTPNPILGIYGAVTRLTREGNSLSPSEAMDIYDAMKMHTAAAAAAGFAEKAKGTISKGKDADFVVLSENPMGISPERIKNVKVLITIIGGKMVWRRDGSGNKN